VLVERIDGQADDFDAAFVEFRLDPGHVAELGGADRGEVLGMREQHRPLVADPIVKADLSFGRLRFEIRGSIIDCKSHRPSPDILRRTVELQVAGRPRGEHHKSHNRIRNEGRGAKWHADRLASWTAVLIRTDLRAIRAVSRDGSRRQFSWTGANPE
jgi:hypothetical protein